MRNNIVLICSALIALIIVGYGVYGYVSEYTEYNSKYPPLKKDIAQLEDIIDKNKEALKLCDVSVNDEDNPIEIINDRCTSLMNLEKELMQFCMDFSKKHPDATDVPITLKNKTVKEIQKLFASEIDDLSLLLWSNEKSKIEFAYNPTNMRSADMDVIFKVTNKNRRFKVYNVKYSPKQKLFVSIDNIL